MASLMENLISVLQQECDAYEGLLELSRQKTPAIVAGNLEELSRITEEEQERADVVQNLDKKRVEVTKDIANVLNRDVEKLKLRNLIDMLGARPQEQKALSEAHDRLQASVHELTRINAQNLELLQSGLEMIQFEMNLAQAYQAAPETANYSRGAYSTGDALGSRRGNFDAKQ